MRLGGLLSVQITPLCTQITGSKQIKRYWQFLSSLIEEELTKSGNLAEKGFRGITKQY